MSHARSETSPGAIIEHWRQNKSSQLRTARLDVSVLGIPEAYKMRRLTEVEKDAASFTYDGDDDLPWYGIFLLAEGTLLAVCDDLSVLIHAVEEAEMNLYFA